MFTIHAENPSIKDYIQEMGIEKIEQLVLDYLKTKAQFHKVSVQKHEANSTYATYGISKETHNKLLALKPRNSKKAKELSQFRDDISKRLENHYGGKSVNEIRDEYFISKGYL